MSRHSMEENCRMIKSPADEQCLAVTGMTVQEYERFMCGCPACCPHVAPCDSLYCTECRMDWFASWRTNRVLFPAAVSSIV